MRLNRVRTQTTLVVILTGAFYGGDETAVGSRQRNVCRDKHEADDLDLSTVLFDL